MSVSTIENLTATGFIEEGKKAVRMMKASCGDQIEVSIATHKLQQIAKPDQATYNTEIIKNSMKSRSIFFDGLVEDYSGILGRQSPAEKGLTSIRQRAEDSIKRDLETTSREYADMSFSENSDPRLIARDNIEESMITEAGKLLGYEVIDNSGSTQFKATPAYKTGGDLETVIANRINIGLAGLFKDYESMTGTTRRPIRRVIVAMADHMAKTLRSK